MKLARIALLSLCLAAGGAAVATVGVAASTGNALSMDQAVKMVEQRYQARVVKAETQKDGARTVYELRLYNKSSGKVWTVHVDAADGSLR